MRFTQVFVTCVASLKLTDAKVHRLGKASSQAVNNMDDLRSTKHADYFGKVKGTSGADPNHGGKHDKQGKSDKQDEHDSNRKSSWQSAPKNAKDWITANPGKALIYGGAGVTFAIPAVVFGPVLGAVGFGAAGPIAGIAAGSQAVMGNVVAGGVFATLQSAAMGGYGVAAVSGVTQAGAAGVAVGTKLMGGKKGDTQESAGKEVGADEDTRKNIEAKL